MAECGKGWAIRCATAKGAKCVCSCGGANHGRLYEQLIPGRKIEEFHVVEGGINFFVKFKDLVDLATLRMEQVIELVPNPDSLCERIEQYVAARKKLKEEGIDKKKYLLLTRDLRKDIPKILIEGVKVETKQKKKKAKK